MFNVLLFFLGCAQSPLLFRAGADYFPLKIDNTWVYSQTENVVPTDTVTLKVIKKVVVESRECWLLERNGCPEYWWKDENRLNKFYSKTIFVNGEEDTIASFWITWLYLPLVTGDEWEHIFKEESYIIGDTVKVELKVKGEVVDLENEDYKVRIRLIENQESMEFGTHCDTTIYDEWYSPNIGVVRRVYDETEEKLITYKEGT